MSGYQVQRYRESCCIELVDARFNHRRTILEHFDNNLLIAICREEGANQACL
jgi:hypothetical protein